MATTQVQKIPTNPAVLRAFADLLARGYSREDMMSGLRISQATYYRRLKEVERAKAGRLVRDE